MPNPQYSSFSFLPAFNESPYKEWLQFTTTKDEFMNLAKTFYGMPKSWFEWTEKQVLLNIRHGVEINNPLTYRLTILWRGIILLQESKFICDAIENALRHSFTGWNSLHLITYKNLLSSIPDWNILKNQYEREMNLVIDLESIIEPEVVLCFTIYQLTETMARNWKYIPDPISNKFGFRYLFWNRTHCRDMNVFRQDMKRVRELRNKTAHSKQLFTPQENQELYKIACRWLDPLDIELKERILTYRSKRPKFLQDLIMQ